MNNVVMLPKAGVDAKLNLSKLVQHYHQVMPFKVEWHDFIWDVSGFVKDTARKAKTKKKLYFTQDNKLANKAKQSVDDMLPFYTPTLGEIAKCHICAKQIEKAKNLGSLQQKLNMYRFLDNELHKRGLPVSGLTNRIFSEALQEAVKKLKESTAYRAGVNFNEISKFIDKRGLADVKIKFKSHLKRSKIHTASDTSLDVDSVTERNDKLPTKEVLIAIAQLTNMKLEKADRLYHAITEILFATGLRFDEVISLSVDCLYEKECQEINQLTGELEAFLVWELKYFSKKSGNVYSKTIADSMVNILKAAIDFVIEYHKPVREIINNLEINNNYNFFNELSGKCYVSEKEIYSHIASSRSNASTRLNKLGVVVSLDVKKNRRFFYAEELQDVTSDLAMEDIRKLWKELKPMTTATTLSDLLFITQHQKEHGIKSVNPWDFRVVSHTQYSDFMTGRDTATSSIKSIFERRELLIDGQQFKVTSHQFRHFLNTICQLHDGINELEISRYFGRSYQGDNQAYDHTNKAKLVMDNAQQILAANSITEEQAIEAMVNFTLVDSEEALEAIRDLTTTLVTSVGLCKHDFADSPCGKHYACLRGCSSYKRTKGDTTEIKELNRIIAQEEKHIADAKEAVDKEFWGANNWLLSHQDLQDGCVKALAIEDDIKFKIGEVIQIFPNGNDSCLALEE
jgi:hypothetical protein